MRFLSFFCGLTAAINALSAPATVDTATVTLSTVSSNSTNLKGIDSYGNWCGGGHGGLQDCCEGGKCPSCNADKGVTDACLKECPPKDGMDRACVDHDFCCFNNEKHIDCSPEGNYCACDCALIAASKEDGICDGAYCHAYVQGLRLTFVDGTSCFSGQGKNQVCHQRPLGDELQEYC